MILLTIGTQLPFDRLVQALDEITPLLRHEVFGQIGQSEYTPVNMQWSAFLGADEFDVRFRAASVVVSHAGIGTILSAQKYRKPLIIVPRLARYGEHRNDHQLATANQVREKRGVYVAEDVDALPGLLGRDDLEPAGDDDELPGRMMFVNNLRGYVAGWQ
ncbi:MAG: glycosyltransferase [Devosia sp.]|nr:glycosyltransferase [Devosia sp.]